MAAISSSLSPSTTTFKSFNNHVLKHHFATPTHTIISRNMHIPSVSTSSYASYIEPVLVNSVPSWKFRRLSVLAAVAQDQEAAVASSSVDDDGDDQSQTEDVSVQEVVNTKLYFGNLPYNVDSAQLAGIIQEYGIPELVEVLYNRDTGKSRGFAFVTMSSIEDCDAVIENLDGSQYMGRILRVNYSDKPKPREPLYPETEHKLFVGNLSWSVTSESLTQAFEQHGNVKGARVLYDGETGRSRGYGFVCYTTKEEMETALESMNGVELEGRAIRVSLAQGRKS